MAEPERGTYYGATQQGGNSGDVRTFPSVKTVMDAVAAGAGLSTVRDDDSFFASSGDSHRHYIKTWCHNVESWQKQEVHSTHVRLM